MILGIVGLPQVGKKTIFSILTGIAADKAPSRSGITYGTAPVRDPRIDALSAIFNPKKTRYAEFEIALPPDIEPDAARAASWLEPLRNVDAFVHVVRAFEAPDVYHIAGSVAPARDLSLVDTELLLADLALVETRLERMEKDKSKKLADVNRDREKAVLLRCGDWLEEERALRDMELSADELDLIRSLQFLTLKPTVLAINADEDLAAARAQAEELVGGDDVHNGVVVVVLSATIEAELAELPDEDREMFMEELELAEPASHRLSRAAYESLGLISFFTVGEDEVRAWPVRRGACAPEAAGRIHSDLERGFIRADTITYDDFMGAGSEQAARQQKLYRLNGKEYEVRDGDIMEIRFNV